MKVNTKDSKHFLRISHLQPMYLSLMADNFQPFASLILLLTLSGDLDLRLWVCVWTLNLTYITTRE